MDMAHTPGSTNGNNDSPPSQKRQRAKQACEPCRLRKRRCDGAMPCNMCTQFEYKCYFEKHPRKRSKIVEQDAVENGLIPPTSSTLQKPGPPKQERPSPEDMSKIRSMEANSGIAFTRLLGMRLDASAGPKLFTFGWNLGTGSRTAPITRPITDFLTQDQMTALAQLYFEHVQPLYGMFDMAWVFKQIVLRFSTPEPVKCPDHVFAGIAALGALFSNTGLDHLMPGIVDSAKLALESTSTMSPPNLIDVQSWILRTIYLRACGHPHACWLASSITMHLVESVGLHQEAGSAVMYPSATDHTYDPEMQRRTFWISRMLNTWVSFEYGRSRVALRGITCQLPAIRDADHTRDYINLYSLSCCLDPEQLSNKPEQWEEFLKQLEAYEAKHDAVELSKANLALIAYRRLRLANPSLPTETINRIINLGLKGCQAARNMAVKRSPWWHVANVPFQSICVFLAMDTRESISHIATAMRTLEFVVESFNTTAMKEALRTARFLIRLSKRKKEEDSDVLGQSLKKDVVEPQPQLVNPQQQPQLLNGVPAYMGAEDAAMTTSSGEDWNLDYLNNTEFDWNFFLSQDIPAFSGLAPDGMM